MATRVHADLDLLVPDSRRLHAERYLAAAGGGPAGWAGPVRRRRDGRRRRSNVHPVRRHRDGSAEE